MGSSSFGNSHLGVLSGLVFGFWELSGRGWIFDRGRGELEGLAVSGEF